MSLLIKPYLTNSLYTTFFEVVNKVYAKIKEKPFLPIFIFTSVFWMIAMTKFEITVAYPFMSLAPAIVFILGVWVLNEPFTLGKVIGLLCIMVGIVVTVKF